MAKTATKKKTTSKNQKKGHQTGKEKNSKSTQEKSRKANSTEYAKDIQDKKTYGCKIWSWL